MNLLEAIIKAADGASIRHASQPLVTYKVIATSMEAYLVRNNFVRSVIRLGDLRDDDRWEVLEEHTQEPPAEAPIPEETPPSTPQVLSAPEDPKEWRFTNERALRMALDFHMQHRNAKSSVGDIIDSARHFARFISRQNV